MTYTDDNHFINGVIDYMYIDNFKRNRLKMSCQFTCVIASAMTFCSLGLLWNQYQVCTRMTIVTVFPSLVLGFFAMWAWCRFVSLISRFRA